MRNAFRSAPWRRLAIAILALCAAPEIPAQTTSELTGTVIDASGAAVPSVKMTVVNQETNATRELQTDDSGLYRLPFLQPGIYAITVEKSGFKPISR